LDGIEIKISVMDWKTNIYDDIIFQKGQYPELSLVEN
jgi:hypothetical protein